MIELDDVILERAKIHGQRSDTHFVAGIRAEIRELAANVRTLSDLVRSDRPRVQTMAHDIEGLQRYVETHLHAVVELLNTRPQEVKRSKRIASLNDALVRSCYARFMRGEISASANDKEQGWTTGTSSRIFQTLAIKKGELKLYTARARMNKVGKKG